MFGAGPKVPKTAVQLYRDCLRAIRHTAARSEKAEAMKKLVRAEFERNRQMLDPRKIEKLRQNAFDGVNNYVFLHTLSQTRPELLQHAAQNKMNVLGGMNPMQQGFMAAGDIKEAIEKLEADKETRELLTGGGPTSSIDGQPDAK